MKDCEFCDLVFGSGIERSGLFGTGKLFALLTLAKSFAQSF